MESCTSAVRLILFLQNFEEQWCWSLSPSERNIVTETSWLIIHISLMFDLCITQVLTAKTRNLNVEKAVIESFWIDACSYNPHVYYYPSFPLWHAESRLWWNGFLGKPLKQFSPHYNSRARDAQTIWAEVQREKKTTKKSHSRCDFEHAQRSRVEKASESPEAPLSRCLITQVQRRSEAAACWDSQKNTKISRSTSEGWTCGPVPFNMQSEKLQTLIRHVRECVSLS